MNIYKNITEIKSSLRYIFILGFLLITYEATAQELALNQYLASYAECPQNTEPLIYAAQQCANINQPSLCHLFSSYALTLPRPENKDLCNKLYYLFSSSALAVGDYEHGYQILNEALEQDPKNTQLLKTLVAYTNKNNDIHKATQTKIIQIHPYLKGVSGVENHLSIFNKMLYEKGFCSQILTCKNSTYIVNKLNQEDHRYGLPCATYNHDDYLCRTSDIIKQKPTIIICNTLLEVNAALIARQYIPLTIIFMYHLSNIIYSDEDIKLLNNIDGITTVNPLEAEILQKFKDDKKINVPVIRHIPPFVDSKNFSPTCQAATSRKEFGKTYGLTIAEDEPIIAMIANIYPGKGHTVLINAAEILRFKKNKKFQLLFAGYGPDYGKHQNSIDQKGLSDCVHFIGHIPNTSVQELLYHSTIHVLSSSKEGFGLAHVEAALTKKPFIAARNTGITQYITTNNGFIFDPYNAQELADIIEYLLDNPEQCKAMGEQAYQLACNELSAEATFNKWQFFLAEVIEKKNEINTVL